MYCILTWNYDIYSCGSETGIFQGMQVDTTSFVAFAFPGHQQPLFWVLESKSCVENTRTVATNCSDVLIELGQHIEASTKFPKFSRHFFIPSATKLGGVYWIHRPSVRPSLPPSVRPSLPPSVRRSVRPSVCPSVNLSCPPCSIYSSGWILSIFGTNDH